MLCLRLLEVLILGVERRVISIQFFSSDVALDGLNRDMLVSVLTVLLVEIGEQGARVVLLMAGSQVDGGL